MTLVEILIQLVGPSIARLILSRWLQSDQVGDVSAPLIESIRAKTHDIVAQREASRLFEKIGDDVAKSLEPLFTDELKDSSRQAVAMAVAETLNYVPIDMSVLVTRDLDPRKLSELFFDGNPKATKSLSASESEFYRRMIIEVSENIIDISSRLPSFTESTLGEILRRSSELLERVDTILQEVHQLRSVTNQDNESQKAAEFELAYRRAIIRKLDKLELFGADVSNTSREQSISVAYITLSVALKKEGEIKDVKLRVDELMTLQRRLLILGDAGSGKTTLLQWIAVNAAANADSSNFPSSLLHLNGLIPFFLPLRQFAQGDLPGPENFVRPIAAMIAGEMPNSWVHTQLKNGRALILIDGVDEIRPSLRKSVQKWIDDLTAQYPHCFYVVTSRPSAIMSNWLKDFGFLPAALLPMDKQEMELFMSHWHEAVKSQLRFSEEKTEIDMLRDHIVDIVWHNRGIRELATNPLLCAMLCALHRDRRQQLPSERVELYEACSIMLLERRDVERRVESNEFPKLSYSQKRSFMEGLAYWMLKNGWSIVTFEQAIEEFDRRIRRLRELPEHLEGKSVLTLFLERSGMLRMPSTEEISFAHKTFQEYFAARATIDEGDIGLLLQQALNDEWREVIILAAGLAPKVTRSRLIEEIIKAGDEDEGLVSHYYLLALACMHASIDAGLLDDEAERLKQKISSLLPPTSPSQAQEIAIAGDAIVPYLVANSTYSEDGLANSVIALYTIGSKKSLEVLKSYVHENHPSVLEKILKGREFFDPITYDNSILDNCLGQQVFRSSSLDTLDGMQHLKNLRSISATMSSRIRNLRPLSGLLQLETLDLQGCDQLSDLTPLSALTNLRELNLSACSEIQDIDPIKHLRNLRKLQLTHNPYISDLGPLTELAKLEYLNISSCSRINSLKGVEHCKLLRKIDLSSESGKRLIQIFGVNLTDTPKMDEAFSTISLDPIRDLTRLEELDVIPHHVNSLKPLSKLTSLRVLGLVLGHEIVELESLSNLKSLEELAIMECRNIKDLSPFRNFLNLRTLTMSNADQVKDFRILEQLPKLESVTYFGGNSSQLPAKFRRKETAFTSYRSKISRPNIIEYAGMPNLAGRGEEIRAFQKYLETSPKNKSIFISFSGTGGIGKTALIQEIIRREKYDVAIMDLALREEFENLDIGKLFSSFKNGKPESTLDTMSKELSSYRSMASKDETKLKVNRSRASEKKPNIAEKPFQDKAPFNKRRKNRH